ncbi:MAG: histidine phosphatase family protein [Thermodesulfobacteriota bacterium]|nr:histidine phosphatase family protein [Thermodesulfobacteriota bacterium]
MNKPTRIILLRHGEVENPGSVFYGQQNVSLSDSGRKQSLALADRLKDIPLSMVFSSDLSRCLFLAEAIAGERGLAVEARSELREVDFGRWAGLSWEAVEARYPGALSERMGKLESYRPPQGENLVEVALRVWRVIDEVLKKCKEEAVAIVSHGGVNRVLIARATGFPLKNIFSLEQDFACVNVLDFYPDGPVTLRLLNWSADKGITSV